MWSELVSFRKRLVRSGRHLTPTWRYVFNLRSTISYRLDDHQMNDEAARIVDHLNRHGIAISSVDRLFGSDSCFEELKHAVEQLETEWSDRIEQARVAADPGEIGQKTFILQFLGDRPDLDPQSIYARFALQPQILEIANSYFGMYTQLRYYNVWHTLRTRGPARESQLWHHDREDHLILKLFIYLSDVDAGAGPFTYAPGTHRKGRHRRASESIDEKGVKRWTDDQMSLVIPPDRWIRATGPTGTIVFADTRGYHKGGLARERDRILYTCLFTSPTSQAPELFQRPKQMLLPAGKAQARALAMPARGVLA